MGTTLGDGFGEAETGAGAAADGFPIVVIVGKIFPEISPPVNIRYKMTEKTAPLMGERKMPNLP